MQITEKKFKKVLDSCKEPKYVTKMQVNPHAHTPTVSDYLIQTNNWDNAVECKEVRKNNRKSKPVFDTKRMTQEYRMVQFENKFNRNRAYVLIHFWGGRDSKSSRFLIPIQEWVDKRRKINKRTLTEEDVMNNFTQTSWEHIIEVLFK